MKTVHIPDEVMNDSLNNIHIIEPLKRGLLKVIVDDPSLFLTKTENVNIAYIRNENGISELMPLVQDKEDVLCVSGYEDERIRELGHWSEDFHDYNYAYLKKEKINDPLEDGMMIRPLVITDLQYVYDHYETVQDWEYLKDRILAGMLGICVDGNLCGFIGTHPEGTMGILYIEPSYRHRHLAFHLEAAFINILYDQGIVPFGQVDEHNTASIHLQESLGLVCSTKPVHWFF